MEFEIIYSESNEGQYYSDVIYLLNDFYIKELKEEPQKIRKNFAFYAKSNGELLGGIVGFSEFNWVYLDSIYVHEKYRRLGIATKLMKLVEELCVSRSCYGLKLESYENSKSFYAQLGYSVFYTENEPNKNHIFYMKKVIKDGKLQ